MSLVIATSVYHLRKSRPLEYYLTPAIDMLNDLANSNINICLFTDLKDELFPKSDNIHTFNINYNDLIKDIWDDTNWETIYKDALINRHKIIPEIAEQRDIPKLLAIWLGKFQMMKIASQYGDVLWQDSAIMMPRLFEKDFSKYKKCKLYPEKYNELEISLCRHPLVFMNCDKYIVPYHGVIMRKYGRRQDLIRAGFIFSRSSEIQTLQTKIKEKWNLLINNNDYGTEENPMTLYLWERNDIGIMSYDNWLTGIGMV